MNKEVPKELQIFECHAQDIIKIAEDSGINSDQFYIFLLAKLAFVKLEGINHAVKKITGEEK